MLRKVEPLLVWSQGTTGTLSAPDYLVLASNSIAEAFSAFPQVTPVLVFGHPQCGKSTILDQLVPGNLDLFRNTEVEGISVYPYPVSHSGCTLLLMEAGLSWSDPQSLDSAKKLLYVALSACSGGLICLESSGLFANAAQLLEVCQLISPSTGGACKFVLFVEKPELLEGRLHKEYAKFLNGPHRDKTTILCRGTTGISPTCLEDLSNWISSCGSILISEFLHKLSDLCKLSEYCLTYKDFCTPQACTSVRKNREALLHPPLNLFVRDSNTIIVNEESVKVLSRNFALDRPTVVLVVLGEQGLGKSSLLNKLVQYLARLTNPLEVFRTGNTETHTTTESQVLAMPLWFPCSEHQLMLIDLEGLGGMETGTERACELQKLLAASVLAVSSVQCILVRNEVLSLRRLEERLEVLAAYRDEFGLPVETINILFHDKDLEAPENSHLTQSVELYKVKFGLKNTRITVFNKPSFVSSPKSTIDEFLRRMLEASDSPKKFGLGKMESLADILTKLKEIIDLKRALIDLRPTKSEQQLISKVVAEGTRSITEIEKNIQIEERTSLVAEFRERCSGVIKNQQLEREPICVKRLITKKLQDVVEKRVSRLREIEQLHDQLSYFSTEEVMTAAKNQAILEVRSAHWIHPASAALPAHLNELVSIYPSMKSKCDAILSVMKNLRRKLLCSIAFTCIFLFTSFQLDFPLLMKFAPIALWWLVIYFYLLGLMNTTWEHRPAQQLSAFNSGVWRYSNAGVVVMAVGANSAEKVAFLNAVCSTLSCFAHKGFQTFNNEPGVRCFEFKYVDQQKQVCPGLIIDVQIDDEVRTLNRVTKSLLASCSHSYFFLLKPEKPGFASLLDTSFECITEVLRQSLSSIKAATVIGSNLQDEDRERVHTLLGDIHLEEVADGWRELGREVGRAIAEMPKKEKEEVQAALQQASAR